MRLVLSKHLKLSVWRINSVCRAYWGRGCYSCDVRGDITVAERIFQTCRNLENRKTAVCNCSFCESVKKKKKTGTLPHGIIEVAISTKLELGISGFADSGTLPHGISGVAVLVDQHIAKNCLTHAQFYSFKNSTKRIKNLKAFSSVKLEIQQNTKGLLTMSRISSTIFQKVRMASLIHSLYPSSRLVEENMAVSISNLYFAAPHSWDDDWSSLSCE